MKSARSMDLWTNVMCVWGCVNGANNHFPAIFRSLAIASSTMVAGALSSDAWSHSGQDSNQLYPRISTSLLGTTVLCQPHLGQRNVVGGKGIGMAFLKKVPFWSSLPCWNVDECSRSHRSLTMYSVRPKTRHVHNSSIEAPQMGGYSQG